MDPLAAARWRFVLGAYLATRAALAAVLYAATAGLPAAPGTQDLLPGHPFVSALTRWDAGWYDTIVRRGYFVDGPQSDVAFFPLYPYLARVLGGQAGGHLVAGLLLSQVALVAALLAVHALALPRLGEDGARRAVWLVLLHPATIFLSAYYPESLFLACAAGSFACIDRDRIVAAGLLGAAATLTRAPGILLYPALLVAILHRHHWRVDGRLALRSLWLLLLPAALAAFMALLSVRVGDPLAFTHAQGGWQRGLAFPLTTWLRDLRSLAFSPYHGTFAWAYPLDVLASAGLFVVAALALRFEPGQALFALLAVVVPLASGRTLSVARFSVGVPALFLVLAAAGRRPAVERALVTVFAMLAALHAALFARGYWAG